MTISPSPAHAEPRADDLLTQHDQPPMPDVPAQEITFDQLDQSQLNSPWPAPAKSAKQALRDAVAAIVGTVDVVFNQFDEPYLVFEQAAIVQLIPLDSQDAVDWARLAIFQRTGQAISEDTAKAELGLLRARAKQVKRQVRMHKRTAMVDGTLFVDLGTPSGEVIAIAGGAWSVQPNTGVFFFRGPGYGKHPLPCSAGGPLAALSLLLDWLVASGLPESSAKVLTAMVAYALIPGVPKPIIEFTGAPGASKSTKSQQLVQLIDPTTTQFAPEVPIKEEHIAAAARQHIVLIADNQNGLTSVQSDLFCRVTSGTSISQRKLYQQGVMHVTEVQVTIILNGVNSVLLRADLRNRACTYRLPPRTNFQTAEEVQSEFERQLPALLGALCDLVAAALATIPQVPAVGLQLRLADLARFGEAMLIACGEPHGTFIDLLQSLQRTSSRDMLTEDQFTSTVLDILRGCVKPPLAVRTQAPPVREWIKGSGKAGWTAYAEPGGRIVVCIGSRHLLSRLRNTTLYRNEGWMPEDERKLNNALHQATPAFRDVDIDASQEKFGDNTGWRFSWMPPIAGIDLSGEPS